MAEGTEPGSSPSLQSVVRSMARGRTRTRGRGEGAGSGSSVCVRVATSPWRHVVNELARVGKVEGEVKRTEEEEKDGERLAMAWLPNLLTTATRCMGSARFQLFFSKRARVAAEMEVSTLSTGGNRANERCFVDGWHPPW